jgi:uncharacterized protein YjiS (DUF1127 family)
MATSTYYGHTAGHKDGLIATVVEGIGGALRALLTVVQSRYRRHLAFEELMALDERMLQDIGLLRGDIYSVTRDDWNDPRI